MEESCRSDCAKIKCSLFCS